jgi:hypothetical protein
VPLLDGRLADRGEPRLVSGELLSRLAELLAGQGPAPEVLRDDPDVQAVCPLDHVGVAVLRLAQVTGWLRAQPRAARAAVG